MLYGSFFPSKDCDALGRSLFTEGLNVQSLRTCVFRRTVLHWAAYHDLGDLAEEVLGVAGAEVDAEDAQQ